jgi:hypothetical protein
MNELETHSKNKNIIDKNRRINEFKGYHPRKIWQMMKMWICLQIPTEF